MPINNLYFKVSLKYGITGFAVLLFSYFILSAFGVNPLLDISSFFFDGFIFFWFIYFAQKEYKDYRNDGILHFWQGMTISFFVYAIISILYLIFLITKMNFDSSVLERYILETTRLLGDQKNMIISRLGQEVFNQQMERVKNITVSEVIFSVFVKKIAVGLLISPVVSIILRKRPSIQK